MNYIINKYKLLSECYNNPVFASRVYLEMLNQFPNMTLNEDDFDNMIYDIYSNFLDENVNYLETVFNEANSNNTKQKNNNSNNNNNNNKLTPPQPIPYKAFPISNKTTDKINAIRQKEYYRRKNLTPEEREKLKNTGKAIGKAAGVTAGAIAGSAAIVGLGLKARYNTYKMATGDDCSFREWIKMGKPTC